MAATRKQTKRWVVVGPDGNPDPRFEAALRKSRRGVPRVVVTKTGSKQPKPTVQKKVDAPKRLDVQKRDPQKRREISQKLDELEKQVDELAVALKEDGVEARRRVELAHPGRDLGGRGGVLEIERASGHRETVDLGPDDHGAQDVRRMVIDPTNRRERVAGY